MQIVLSIAQILEFKGITLQERLELVSVELNKNGELTLEINERPASALKMKPLNGEKTSQGMVEAAEFKYREARREYFQVRNRHAAEQCPKDATCAYNELTHGCRLCGYQH